MKVFTYLLLTLGALSSCLAQDKKTKSGYAGVGSGVLITNKIDNKVNLNAGIGFYIGQYLSAGPAFDLYIFKDPKFVIAKADFRIYPVQNTKEVSPYVALKPGYVLYNQNNTKGAASVDLLVGIMARPIQKKGIGINLSAGYSKFGFKTSEATTYNDAIKIEAGIIF